VEDARVEVYQGTLDEYMYSSRVRRDTLGQGGDVSSRPAVASEAATSDDSGGRRNRDDDKARKRREAALRNKRYKVLGPLKKRVTDLEERITALEAEQAGRSQLLADPAVYEDGARRDQLISAYQSAASKLEELTGRWEMAQEELDSAEAEMAAEEARELG
jgi:ATP-binding cassette subfamily F protein 3